MPNLFHIFVFLINLIGIISQISELYVILAAILFEGFARPLNDIRLLSNFLCAIFSPFGHFLGVTHKDFQNFENMGHPNVYVLLAAKRIRVNFSRANRHSLHISKIQPELG